jgi:hypothetical protein
MRKTLGLAILGVLAAAAVATADEAKTRISPTMFLDLTAPRAVARDTAYLESLKAEPSVPPRPANGEVQDDGSVRYGNVTVTVRNPCPPGSLHDEPKPLPGRRSR